MTQLYVGNLSADADEAAVRALFSKYGIVRETLMKNGYAFVEYDTSLSAEEAMRALNGTDILGHPMIVEPSHQQRLSSRRKAQCGKVEVSGIPPHMTYQGIEAMLGQVGQILKMEIEDGDYGVKKIIVTYESMEQAQRASATFKGDEHTPRVTFIEGSGANGMRVNRRGSPGIPTSPSKSNSDFPLRILVPSDMVGAIIGKDGATIRMITQLTKARVDVHRRENLGSAEKAITIIGPPECCTEACYQIMKIMQNELLMTSGMMENGTHPDHIHLYDEAPPPHARRYHEPLPVVPLKILAHNELVGRVIGKGGNTLKRIMAESGTKITISKLKDLTAYNMERTITILGTIDNCKKAESLISAKLRASYESDMAQFIPEQSHISYPGPNQPQTPLSPSPGPPPMSNPLPEMSFGARLHPQSLPATPTATNVRTFTDFSAEHTRLTTLHGSTGALEVNNLGGFKLGPLAMNGMNGSAMNGTSVNGGGGTLNGSLNGMSMSNGHTPVTSSSAARFPNAFFESTFDGVVKSSNGGMNGVNGMQPSLPPPPGPPSNPYDFDDEISDVFSGLSMDPVIAAPGYGRARNRRCSAPVNSTNPPIWGSEIPENGSENLGYFIAPPPPKAYSSTALSSTGWNGTAVTAGSQSTVSSIWTTPFQGSRPESQASSYSNSNSDQGSSLSGYSPIYSPVATTTNGFFEINSGTLLTTNPMTTIPTSEDQRPSFKVSVPTTLTTVAENTITTTSMRGSTIADDHDEELLKTVTSTALELIGDTQPNMSGPPW